MSQMIEKKNFLTVFTTIQIILLKLSYLQLKNVSQSSRVMTLKKCIEFSL